MLGDAVIEGPFLGMATAPGAVPPAEKAAGAWPDARHRPTAGCPATAKAWWAEAARNARRGRESVAACVASALLAVEAGLRPLERRELPRFPYPYPIHLTPLDPQGRPLVPQTFAVIGRHLSPQGVDFYGPSPLAERRVVASLDGGAAGWLGLVVELTWCRFSRHGWYDQGGRFLAVVPSPLAAAGDAKATCSSYWSGEPSRGRFAAAGCTPEGEISKARGEGRA